MLPTHKQQHPVTNNGEGGAMTKYGQVQKYDCGLPIVQWKVNEDFRAGGGSDIGTVFTPIGSFFLTEVDIRYEGVFGQCNLVTTEEDPVALDMVYTVLAMFPLHWIGSHFAPGFKVWLRSAGQKVVHHHDTAYEWHMIGQKICNAFVHYKEWLAPGRMRQLTRPAVLRDAKLPVFDAELYEIIHGPILVPRERQIWDFARTFYDVFRKTAAVDEKVEVPQKVEEEKSEEKVEESVVEPAVVMSSVLEKSELVDQKSESIETEITSIKGNSWDDYPVVDIAPEYFSNTLVTAVGCTEDLFRSETELSKKMVKWSRINAAKLIADPKDTKSPLDPFELGYCHLMFFEGQGLQERIMEKIGPYLTPGNYDLVNSMRDLRLSERVVSFRFYGTRLHVSYLPGLPTARACDLWDALGGAFRRAKVVVDDLLVAKSDIGEIASHFDSLFTERRHERGKHRATPTTSESGGDFSEYDSDDPDDFVLFGRDERPELREPFRTLSVDGEWRGLVVQDVDIAVHARFLRRFFLVCGGCSTVSEGSKVLVTKGLKALEEYSSAKGNSRSSFHAILRRSVKGLLNACVNESVLWAEVNGKIGKEMRSVFR